MPGTKQSGLSYGGISRDFVVVVCVDFRDSKLEVHGELRYGSERLTTCGLRHQKRWLCRWGVKHEMCSIGRSWLVIKDQFTSRQGLNSLLRVTHDAVVGWNTVHHSKIEAFKLQDLKYLYLIWLQSIESQ